MIRLNAAARGIFVFKTFTDLDGSSAYKLEAELSIKVGRGRSVCRFHLNCQIIPNARSTSHNYQNRSVIKQRGKPQ